MTDGSDLPDPVEELLGRALAKADQPPPATVAAAAALADFIDLDAAVARLLEEEQAAVRDPGMDQRTYAWDDGSTLHLQTQSTDQGLEVTGLLSGFDSDTVTIQTVDGDAATAPVARGSFEIRVPATGRYRLRFGVEGGRRVTPWESSGQVE